MQTLAILGLGLMGGSLGLAARRRSSPMRVQAYARREESRVQALELGVADETFASPENAVAGADVVVVCVPVLKIPELVDQCAAALDAGALLTDVGSTKREVVDIIASRLEGVDAEFVGSHPMAGSEQTGLSAARHDLYDNATVVVTPSLANREAAVQRIESFWKSLGARVENMLPEIHDALVARTSHLPHMVAAALVSTVLGESRETSGLCASGFLDTTRVAAGSEDIWHDIVKTNPDALSEALGDMIVSLQSLRALIESGAFDRVHDYLGSCRSIREALDEGPSS